MDSSTLGRANPVWLESGACALLCHLCAIHAHIVPFSLGTLECFQSSHPESQYLLTNIKLYTNCNWGLVILVWMRPHLCWWPKDEGKICRTCTRLAPKSLCAWSIVVALHSICQLCGICSILFLWEWPMWHCIIHRVHCMLVPLAGVTMPAMCPVFWGPRVSRRGAGEICTQFSES